MKKYVYAVYKSAIYKAKIIKETDKFYYLEGRYLPFGSLLRVDKPFCTIAREAIQEEINRCNEWIDRYKKKIENTSFRIQEAYKLLEKERQYNNQTT